MDSQIECPGCHGQLAYSAALRGRMVRCHLCQHAFSVADILDFPTVEEPATVDTATLAPTLSPPPLPTRPNPPPLPMRGRRDSSDPIEETDDEATAASFDSVDDETHGRRTSHAPVLGLAGLFAFGFLVIASGIGYLVSSGSSPPTAQAVPAAAPAIESPAETERPKSLQEVLGGDAKNDLPAAPPGAMQFDPHQPPARPGIPRPPRGFGPRIK